MRGQDGAEPSRKQRAADAAIEVIAAEGLRGLTHRAVDTWAGLPQGSTSSCFRTRVALLAAVLDRLVELDEAMLASIPENDWSIDTPEHRCEIVTMLTELLLYWLGPARSRTRARMELYLDATRRAELLPELEAANRRFIDRTAAGMRTAGLDHPERAARLLIAYLDGLLYDALARPYLGENDRAALYQAIDTMVRGITSPPD
ncbi:DNA-binding transcriptional regulator YbjK [Saccharomonospora amisosensis]|uniref:DNA-binding transcriptional regulator YbjK n=1 Tax=Saccharomonospora amisosensis TaxID=1128677 RepID=A0A7X5ZQM2_9PSEU|nr:TetR/AcrR family transcriptional regulator [Saccharomonospora amisosensis]NIJ11922.1 DNA-binding transcriptional regulator YbjK [Saccharomonospora amisosensis]